MLLVTFLHLSYSAGVKFEHNIVKKNIFFYNKWFEGKLTLCTSTCENVVAASVF